GSVMGVLSIILLPLVLGGIPLLAQLWNVGVQKIERSLTTIEKGEDSYLKRQLNAVNNELGNVQYELERAAAVEMVAIRTAQEAVQPVAEREGLNPAGIVAALVQNGEEVEMQEVDNKHSGFKQSQVAEEEHVIQ